MKNSYFYLLSFSLCFFAFHLALGQKAGINPAGERIIRLEDGSWRYLQEDREEDIVLWKAYQDSLNKIPTPVHPAEFAKRQLDMVDQWLQQARQEEKAAILDRLLFLENSTEEPASAAMLKQMIQQEEKALAERKAAEKALKIAKKLAANPENEKLLAAINALLPEAKKQKLDNLAQTGASVFFDNAPDKFKKYTREEDVYFFPPPSPCTYEKSGSKNVERMLQPAPLFTYTSEKLRPYLRGEDFITCLATLSRVNQKIYLLGLEIRIASHLARDEFGFIDKQGLLVLYLLDGTKVYLYNHKTDTGELNEEAKTVTYRPEYVLEKTDKKLLESSELTQVRLIWSTGYEDYPVYEMDFFRDRLPCLDE